MQTISRGLLVLAFFFALTGCQAHSPAVNTDGRPTAPSGQSVPGGPVGEGPVGQPQA